MGQPVVHFEITGTDGEKLQSYYSDLFGWAIKADNEMKYGIVDREGSERRLDVLLCLQQGMDDRLKLGRIALDGAAEPHLGQGRRAHVE